MNVKQLFADEDAVSPVIGVILMVAITVILAAVIGTFVLGLGENVQDSSPQANFQFEYDDGSTAGYSANEAENVTITHTGGEDVDVSTVQVQIGNTTVSDLSSSNANITSWSDPISTGSTVDIADDVSIDSDASDVENFAAGDEVRVIWTSPSGGTSQTIGQSTIPS